MKKLIFLLIFLSTNLFAQNSLSQDDQFQKQVEEVMKAREEMLKSLMDDSFSGDIEKHMMEMMKRFSNPANPGANFGFDDDSEGAVVGEYDWVVSGNQKILKLKVKQVKDHPLDIKIEKGMVKVKGDVESTSGNGKNKIVSKTHFEKSFSIPEDVDQTTPEFENKDGELLIKFKLLKTAKTKQKAQTPSDRVPVSPSEGDISI
jgi:HSP20 family molecular chaperone IbpA